MKNAMIVGSLILVSSIASAADYRLAYSKSTNLEVMVEHQVGESWCSTSPVLRFQDTGAASLSVLEQTMPKLGVLLARECPEATAVSWYSVDTEGNRLLVGNADAGSEWKLQTTQVNQNETLAADSDEGQITQTAKVEVASEDVAEVKKTAVETPLQALKSTSAGSDSSDNSISSENKSKSEVDLIAATKRDVDYDGEDVSQTKSKLANLEYGLTLLGCDVPKIDGDLSDADEAIVCVQKLFGLPPGELSRDDSHYISAAAANVHSREMALNYLATRGYHPVSVRVAQGKVPQLVGLVPLNFPEVEEPPANKRSIIKDHRFYNFVYDAKISFVQEVSLTKLQPRSNIQRSPHAEAAFLKNFIRPVATLLDPSDESYGGTLLQEWQSLLYEESRYTSFFTEPIMAAIAEAPPVRRCIYDQYSAAPADDRDFLSSARSINLAFWAGPVPDTISPESLRAFQAPEKVLHPLLVIGPPIEACPETLGLALEVMATQFPGQVPAAEPPTLDGPEDSGTAIAEGGPDFSYLPRTTRRYFTSILDGDKTDSESLTSQIVASKIGVYLAFHRAFDTTCRAVMTDDWKEYTFTRESTRLALQEEEKIRLSPPDFEEFYLAAATLVPIVILGYEEDPTKDFGSKDPNASIPEIYAIHTQANKKNEAFFAEVLAREGCQSSLAEELRASLAEHLPQMKVSQGETTVSMSFQTVWGTRSLNVDLDAPYDPDSRRMTRVVSGSDAGLFPLGSDYGGRMLSYLALGDFGAARSEHAKSADEAIRQIRAMGQQGFNPIADFYEWGFRTSDNFNPMNALITSYIIHRVRVLGSCGEKLVPVSRTYVETETTRNGFGTEIMSKEVGRYNEQVMVPTAFHRIVDRAEDITPGVYSSELVDGAIKKLSCNSEMRKSLEANMIAFTEGAER